MRSELRVAVIKVQVVTSDSQLLPQRQVLGSRCVRAPTSFIFRLCGDYDDGMLTRTSKTSKMTVTFRSDLSYVDRGFEAKFEAVDSTDRRCPSSAQLVSAFGGRVFTGCVWSAACPDEFECKNKQCIKSSLTCDGWNDCGDMSDELNCSTYRSLIVSAGDKMSCRRGNEFFCVLLQSAARKVSAATTECASRSSGNVTASMTVGTEPMS